jgi:hypothetical protein
MTAMTATRPDFWPAKSSTRPRGGRPQRKERPALVEVPERFVQAIETVMKALTIDGQKEFKGELHAALETTDPAGELEYTVQCWFRTMRLVDHPDYVAAFADPAKTLSESELLTGPELLERIAV